MTGEETARFAAELDALAPEGLIGIAVSGGPDSLALLLLAAQVRPGEIAAATVNHGLREAAADEAAMVAQLCAAIGVPHRTLAVSVPDDPHGPQAAARKARYGALAAWATDENLASLATAHHADDQAETVLMRLARGAGLRGLVGIRRRRPLAEAPQVTLIRPLLRWRKTELEELVTRAGLEAVRDPTNHDSRYDRTRARDMLAGGWPAAERVAAAAAHLAEAEAALDWAAMQAADRRLVIAAGSASIEAGDLPRELRRRLLLMAFRSLKSGAEPRGNAIDRLLDTLERGDTATLAGLRCRPGSPWQISSAPPRRSH